MLTASLLVHEVVQAQNEVRKSIFEVVTEVRHDHDMKCFWKTSVERHRGP